MVLCAISEKDVRLDNRLNIGEILAEEVHSGWDKIGVVVSGPGGLCDNVRTAVIVAIKQGKTAFELEVDAYSW